MDPISVLVLTQANCAFCETAKEIFYQLSREYPLTVTLLFIDSSEGAALAERGGVMFAPGVFIDGEPFSYGRPSERKIRREIERRLGELAAQARVPSS